MLNFLYLAVNLAARAVDGTKSSKQTKERDALIIDNLRMKREMDSLKEQLDTADSTIAWMQERLSKAVTGKSLEGRQLYNAQVTVLMTQAERHRHFLMSLRSVLEPLMPYLETVRQNAAPDSAEGFELGLLADIFERTNPADDKFTYL